MPDDDITHPIPDLTGYITEGQIVLGRGMYRKGLFPPVDVLPCLSRLMNGGIGEGKTREDHRAVANQLYSAYARGVQLRRLVAIAGEDALAKTDQAYLRFAQEFEEQFISQGESGRTINETLDLGWTLLSMLPVEELTRIKPFMEKYWPKESTPLKKEA
jgi:V/A-type H+-transporting ATPase subunit B